MCWSAGCAAVGEGAVPGAMGGSQAAVIGVRGGMSQAERGILGRCRAWAAMRAVVAGGAVMEGDEVVGG